MVLYILGGLYILLPLLIESSTHVSWSDLPFSLAHYYISVIATAGIILYKYRQHKHISNLLISIALLLCADVINTSTVNIPNRMNMIPMKIADIFYIGFILFMFIFLVKEFWQEIIESKYYIYPLLLIVVVVYFALAEIYIHSQIPKFIPGQLSVNSARVYSTFQALVFAIAMIQASREIRFTRLLILQAIALMCISDFGIKYHNFSNATINLWPGFEEIWMTSWAIIFVCSFSGLSLSNETSRPLISLRSILIGFFFIIVSLWFFAMIQIGVAKVPTTTQLTNAMLISFLIWCAINAATTLHLEVFQKMEFLLRLQTVLGKKRLHGLQQYIEDLIKSCQK